MAVGDGVEGSGVDGELTTAGSQTRGRGRRRARCRRKAPVGQEQAADRVGRAVAASCSTTITAPEASRSAPGELGQQPLGLAGVGRVDEHPGRSGSARRPAARRPSAVRTLAPRTVARPSEPQLAQVAAQDRERAGVALDEDRLRRARATAPRAPAPRSPRRGPAPAPGGGPRMLKIASRTLEAVGPRPLPAGPMSLRPRSARR